MAVTPAQPAASVVHTCVISPAGLVGLRFCCLLDTLILQLSFWHRLGCRSTHLSLNCCSFIAALQLLTFDC
jgi:hypothetical protein